MKKNRILFVTSELVYGGAEKMITFLANGLSKNGYDVFIYSYEGINSNYKLDDNIHFIHEEHIQTNYYTRRLIQIFQVRKKIKLIQPDLVISFLTNQNIFSILGTAFTKIPVIISERGDPYINKGLIASIKYYFYKFADGVVFQTEGAKKFFCKKIQKNSIIIPNPVTSIQYERVPYNERKDFIAFVARFEIKQKRQDIMIEAFRKLLRKHKGFKLVLFGDGPDMQQVEEMVKNYNINENVIFAGKVNDVQKYIFNAKMFVLTSDYEGIPNVLLEAMAIGLPVISTDCSPGGARLLIDNNHNGILVPREDVEKITESMEFYIENPDIAERFGSEAQKITEKYSPQKIITLWIEYIEYIINR